MTWPLARVGDLAEQIRGVTFAKGDTSPVPAAGLLPVMTATNVTELGLVNDSVLYLPRSRVGANQVLRKNDVLVTASSGSLSVVGRTVLVREELDATFGAFCKVLRPRSGVDPHYFAHFFRTSDYRSRVSRVAAGANINNLRNEDLDGFEIPLPPLPEQRRIASILDEVDALRASRRGSVSHFDQLVANLFDRLSLECERRTELGQVLSISAKMVDPRDEAYAELPLVAPDNIEPSTGRIIGVREVGEVRPISGKYKFAATDVLYSKIRPALNKVAMAEGVGLCSADMYPLSVDASQLTREYLWVALRSPAFLTYSSRLANRAQMPKLNREQLLSYQIGLPPIESQREFSRVVQQSLSISLGQREHLAKLDELFASLQYRAFRGEL